MIICPWCGTAYAAFQSNCSRCGGPISPPTGEAAPSQSDEVVFPPPPPRPISDQYRWKLMAADSWSIAGFIFALLGSIFTLLGAILTIAVVTAFVGIPFLLLGLLFLGGGGYVLYWRYREALKSLNILRNGQAVQGQVTGSQVNYSVRVNGRNPLTISYRFQVDGREVQHSLTTLNQSGGQFPTGKNVCVLYLPEAPEYSSLYPHP